MGLESASFIAELNPTNPVGSSDPKSQGDDHLRLIKTALQGTFPNLVGTAGTPKSVTLTEDELNDAVRKTVDNILTGRLETDDSTVTRAGLNIPDGVAPSAPVQGDIWATATDLFIRNNGSDKSLLAVEITAVKTADTVKVTDIVLADDPHLSVQAPGAGRYRFEMFLEILVTSGSTPNFHFGFTSPASTVGHYLYHEVDVAGSQLERGFELSFAGTPEIDLTQNTTSGISFVGTVQFVGSGTFALQWAQSVSSGNAITLGENSHMVLSQL